MIPSNGKRARYARPFAQSQAHVAIRHDGSGGIAN